MTAPRIEQVRTAQTRVTFGDNFQVSLVVLALFNLKWDIMGTFINHLSCLVFTIYTVCSVLPLHDMLTNIFLPDISQKLLDSCFCKYNADIPIPKRADMAIASK